MDHLFEFTRHSLKNYDGSHDMYHALNVCTNVLKLNPEYSTLSFITALLHDTCDAKYVNKAKALANIKSVLKRNMTYEEVEDIVQAIEHVSFSKLKLQGTPSLKSQRAQSMWNIVDVMV